METAKPSDGILVLDHHFIEGEHWFITKCADFDAYKKLPQVVEYKGLTYGMTGWNSDRCVAYYKETIVARGQTK